MIRDYNNIRGWLLPKLESRGFSIERFADSVGVSRAIVYMWLHDQSRPTEQTMSKVCHVLDIPLEEGLSQYTPKPNGRPAGPPNARAYARKRR